MRPVAIFMKWVISGSGRGAALDFTFKLGHHEGRAFSEQELRLRGSLRVVRSRLSSKSNTNYILLLYSNLGEDFS
jgi:hypothetical protein